MKKVSPLCVFIILFALLVQSSGISAQCTSVTFQTGNSQATGARFTDYYPDQNFDYTTFDEISTGQWTKNGNPITDRSLLKFDLSTIPTGSIIVSAQLSLFADSVASGGYIGQPTYGSDNACFLHLVTSSWNAATVTWNTQPVASNTSEVLLPQSTNSDESYLNTDLSTFVQGWVNSPSTNYGMLLEIITQNYYNSMIFCSPSFPDATKWPRLQICYIPPTVTCNAHASFTQRSLGGSEVQFTNTSTDNANQNTAVIWSDNFSAPAGGSNNNNAGQGWSGNTLTPGGTNDNSVDGITNFWTIDSVNSPGICGSGFKLYVSNSLTHNNEYDSDDFSDIYDATPNISTIGDSAMTLSFTWRCKGVSGSDYGLVGLSADGGSSYTWLPTHYQGYTACQGALISIPANYDNIGTFKIAFRFIAGGSSQSTDPPFNIDNIVLTNNGAGTTGNTAFTSYWIFSNGSGPFTSSNAANPLVTFTGQPPYSATLIITDSICSDTITQPVTIGNTNCVTFQTGSTSATGAVIRSISPTSNYDFTNGWGEFFSSQWTWNGVPGEIRSLLQYNLSQIPAGSVIVSANLSLYADATAGDGYSGQPTYGSQNASYIQQVTGPWNPATVTWNTQPTATVADEVSLPQSTSADENYLNLNVNSIVQSWVNDPSSNYGLLLKMISQNYYNSMIFCSTGYPDSTKWPSLQICYIPAVTCSAHASFTQQNLGGSEVQFTNSSTDNLYFTSQWLFSNANGIFNQASGPGNVDVYLQGPPPYTATLIITDSICSDTVSQSVSITNTNCLTFQQGSTKCTGARIESYDATTNWDYTTTASLSTSNWTDGGTPFHERGIFKFDLSSIPSGSTIISARLNLYTDTISNLGYFGQPTYGTDNASYLQMVTSSWNPASVTWNTQPSSTTANEVLLAQSTNTNENYLNIDVSAFAQAWVNNPSVNNGMMLEMIGQDHYNSMIFCSPSFPDSSRWPSLQICYTAPVCNANASFTQQNLSGRVQFTNTSTDNIPYTTHWTFYNSTGAFASSNANNPLINFSGLPPYSATLLVTDANCTDTLNQAVNATTATPICVTFQTGNTMATGAVVRSITPDQNTDFSNGWGEFISSHWTWNDVPGEIRSLMQYDLSQIPAGSAIVSASLSLYADPTAGDGYSAQPTYGSQNASYIEQVTSPWNPATVTWNTQPAATSSNEVLLAQATNSDENYLNLNVSGIVQAWVNNPSSNYGLLLKMISQNYYNSMIFCSSDYPDSTKWPKLEICYLPRASCGTVASFTYQHLGNGVVQFNNTSTSDSGYYSSWVFYNSDGIFANSNEQNPIVTYTGGEPYYAQLTVSDSIFSTCVATTDSLIDITTCMSITFNPFNAYNAIITSLDDTANFGTAPDFMALQWEAVNIPFEARSLMRFNLSQIPAGATIVNSLLSLYADSVSTNGFAGFPMYGNTNATNLLEVTSPWAQNSVTWLNQPSTTPNHSATLGQTTGTSNYPQIDISKMVQDWVNNPTQNYGMMIKMIAQSSDNSMIFCSNDYPDSTRWPSIQICYIAGQVDTVQNNALCGFVFDDFNNNGVYDSGDVPAARIPVLINGNIYYTDSTGYYTVTVGAGLQQISVVPPYGWSQTSPLNPNTYSITTSANQHICGFDFGISNTATGVNDLGLTSDMVIFPTPLNGANFKILVPDGFEMKNASVHLEDMLGREVSIQYLQAQQKLVTVNLLGSLTPGVYIVVLANDSKRLCGRLSVIR